jgi:hypothetical protein
MREEPRAAAPAPRQGDAAEPTPAMPAPDAAIRPSPDAATTPLLVRDRADQAPEARGELGQILAAAAALPAPEQEALALLVLRALPPEASAAALAVAAQRLPPAAQQRLRRVLPAPAIPLEALPWRVLLGTLLAVLVVSLLATIALLARGNPGAGYVLAICLAALGLLGGLLLAALLRQA